MKKHSIETKKQGAGFSCYLDGVCHAYGMDHNQLRFYLAGLSDALKACGAEFTVNHCPEYYEAPNRE